MIPYLQLSERILSEGKWVVNKRTNTRCLTVINADLEYDVANNRCPVVTTRKTPWKLAIAELLGYLKGYTNAQQFADLGAPTWFANANDNKTWLENPSRKGTDDMGLAYRFRTQGYFIEAPNYQELEDTTTFDLREFPDIKVEVNGIIGTVYATVVSGNYKIISDEGKSKDKRIQYYKIQFLDTGYTTVIQKSQIKTKNIKDPYATTVYGIGVFGEPSAEDVALLYKTWSHMIERCYVTTSSSYQNYGGRGCRVSNAWLKFSNFVKDAKSLTNWELKVMYPNEYSIDKDWCNSLLYAKNTCRWSTRKEQANNTRSVKTYKVSKDGHTQYIKGLPSLSKLVGTSSTKLISLFKNNVQSIATNGFTFEYSDKPQLTYVEVDQLKSVVAKLSLGIDDRRLIMSAYYPHLNEFTCLPPCMYSHHFSLLDGTLYLNSTQRSCDILLGGPANMIQCFVLLQLMAQITGHQAGKVFHKIVNAHIYENQLPLVQTQLDRSPFEEPSLIINPEIKTLEDIETWVTVDDFQLVGYKHHDPIKYPFTV